MNTNNIYGIQKSPETEIRSGLDIASATASGAAQGANLLRAAGPYGMAAGAIIGGGISLVNQRSMKREEQRQNFTDKQKNSFVDSLEGRQAMNTNYIPMAREGMKMPRYTKVEAEGDGSNSKNSIGEFHLDKNYNIKRVIKGATHEQGGVPVKMKKGDIILAPREQGDEGPLNESHRPKFDKINNAIKKYKLEGNKAAKIFLDSEVAKLPKEGEIARAGFYENGKSPMFENEEEFKNPFETKSLKDQNRIFNPINSDLLKTNSNKGNTVSSTFDAKYSTKKNYDFSSAYSGKAPQSFDINTAKDIKRKGDPYTYREDEVSGKIYSRGANSKDWVDTRESGKIKDYEGFYKTVTGKDYKKPRESLMDKYLTSPAVIPPKELVPFSKQVSMVENENSVTEDDKTKIKEKTKTKEEKEDYSDIKNRNNVMKYSNMLYNSAMGSKKVDEVNRRYVDSEDYKYQDTSNTLRKSVDTNANAARLAARGSRLSSGQSLSLQNQISASSQSAMEQINEREYAKRLDVSNLNTAQRNQNKGTNLNLSNTYDEQDAQNKGARQAFQSEAARDMTKLGQLEEEKRYLMDKDKKQYKMDKYKTSLMDDFYKNYTIDENGKPVLR